MSPSRHLWLLGLSGSGKSTLGPKLAQALSLPWVDTDKEIVRETKSSIPEIFSKEGEEGFRNRESYVLEKICHQPASVVSCGGGIILRKTNRTQIASGGLRIYLKSDPASLAKRIRAAEDRPLLAKTDVEGVLTRQLLERRAFYEESEIHLDVTRLTPDQAVAALRGRLPAPWSR